MLPSDEMFYINDDSGKDDAEIHEFILRREGLPAEEPPVRHQKADAEPECPPRLSPGDTSLD